MNQDRPINIHVILNGQEYLLQTYSHEYRNLMMLITDRIYPEDFGECKGMGRCGTCHIQIEDNVGVLGNMMGNESSTLGKMSLVESNSRLACQIPVDSKLDGMIIRIMSEG